MRVLKRPKTNYNMFREWRLYGVAYSVGITWGYTRFKRNLFLLH